MKAPVILIAAAALSSCHQAPKPRPPAKAEFAANRAEGELPPIPPPGTGPDARTPLGEPGHAIDPRSAEAAGEVVRRFGALIEEKRFAEAAALWTSADAATAFIRQLRPPTHLQVGELGRSEGAAGSVYMTIAVLFTGEESRRPAKILLRRVNDVPGSTDVQRHWHIERIDWKRSELSCRVDARPCSRRNRE